MRRRASSDEQRISGTSIIRFDVHQRLQHVLMFLSFFTLAGTGLPLKYSEWASSDWWMNRWGGIEVTRVVHRYAAWIMIAVCVYHLLYVIYKLLVKRPLPTAMLPSLKDFRDFVQDMKHTFHMTDERPQYDRFSYRNKGAYWLTWIGSIVMVFTGLILFYPIWSSVHLGSSAYPLALVIHSDAALLAVGWILFLHIYFAHFAPHVFPGDKSIFTGKVPIARYREEFPLEYARIMAAAERSAKASDQTVETVAAGPEAQPHTEGEPPPATSVPHEAPKPKEDA